MRPQSTAFKAQPNAEKTAVLKPGCQACTGQAFRMDTRQRLSSVLSYSPTRYQTLQCAEAVMRLRSTKVSWCSIFWNIGFLNGHDRCGQSEAFRWLRALVDTAQPLWLWLCSSGSVHCASCQRPKCCALNAALGANLRAWLRIPPSGPTRFALKNLHTLSYSKLSACLGFVSRAELNS